jgi:hypothetical protein
VPEKWINEYVISELRPLFLRVRNLDIAKKNEVLRGFLTRMFPNLAQTNRLKLDDIAKHYRNNNWNDWRHNLWAEVQNCYDINYKY